MTTYQKPKTWSFSSLVLYEECPQKYKIRYEDRIYPPKAEAADRGTNIHTGIENFLRSDAELPSEAQSLASDYVNLKALSPEVEADWWFDQDWKPSDKANGWVQMKLDAFVMPVPKECVVVDHKSGKDSPIKRIGQGQLYAIGAANKYPELDKFETRFMYIDQGVTKINNYTRAQVAKFQDTFTKRANKLLSDTAYKPISNKYNCKFCPYGSENLAVCEFRHE